MSRLRIGDAPLVQVNTGRYQVELPHGTYIIQRDAQQGDRTGWGIERDQGVGHVSWQSIHPSLLDARKELEGLDFSIQHQRGQNEKTKTSEVNAIADPVTEQQDWQNPHRPPDADYGAPAHDVSSMMPDFYEHPEYYSQNTGDPEEDQSHYEARSALMKARGNPDAKVRIYRSAPAEHIGTGIKPGDWVSTSKTYARMHGRNDDDPKNDWPIIRATVRAGDIHTSGDDVREWGYNGTQTHGGMVVHKGGYNHEVTQTVNGVRPVKRRAPSPIKGFSFSQEPGKVVAWDPQENYAGHLDYADAGPGEAHVEPQHSGLAGELERRMRLKLPKQAAKTASERLDYSRSRTPAHLVQPTTDNGGVLDYMSGRHPDIDHWVTEDPSSIRLEKIVVPKEQRGTGKGSAYLQDLVDYADAHGKRVELTPDTAFGGSSKSRLEQFYKGFGFVPNKGRSKDYSISNTMYRPPQAKSATKTASALDGLQLEYTPGGLIHDDGVRTLRDHVVRAHIQHPDYPDNPKARIDVGKLYLDGRPDADGRHRVSGIEVRPEYRRQGVATKLWEHAHSLGLNPRHEDMGVMTPEGRSWADAVGDGPAKSTPQHVQALAYAQEAVDRSDADFGFHYTASWKDVQEKARRIRSDGHVRILAHRGGEIVGHVAGDTNVYEARIVFVPGSKTTGYWECACAWGAYSWGRTGRWRKFEGRRCSHVLALQYEAQSRGMFGKDISLDVKVPHWIDPTMPVKVHRDYDRDKGRFSAKTATLKFTKTYGGRYHARGATHSYTVLKDGKSWLLRVDKGGPGEEQPVHADYHDTRAMAQQVAHHFEALGDDYKPHDHGARNRGTEATLRAYDDDTTASKTAETGVDPDSNAKGPGADWRAQLPPEHQDLIRNWEKQRGGELLSTQDRKTLRNLVSTAPKVSEPVYRGHPNLSASLAGWGPLLKKHQPGAVVNFTRHSSVTTRPEVAAGFGHVVYEIQGQHGSRGIGNTLHEALMPPGKYTVQSAEVHEMPYRAAIDGTTMGSSPRLHVKLSPVSAKTAAGHRMMQPEEYRNLKILDFAKVNDLPSLAQRLRADAPEYYQALHEDIARNGVQTPVLIDGDTIMQGHHRLSIAHELGLPVPVADYNDQGAFDANNMQAPVVRDWMQKRYDMGYMRSNLPPAAWQVPEGATLTAEFAHPDESTETGETVPSKWGGPGRPIHELPMPKGNSEIRDHLINHHGYERDDIGRSPKIVHDELHATEDGIFHPVIYHTDTVVDHRHSGGKIAVADDEVLDLSFLQATADYSPEQERALDDWLNPPAPESGSYGDYVRQHPTQSGAADRYTPGASTAYPQYQRGDDWPNVGWVQTDKLLPYREHSGDQHQDSKKVVDSLATSFRNGEGFINPLRLYYHPESHQTFLGEGNHRLQAAMQAGLTHVPVTVHLTNESQLTGGANKPVPAQWKQRHDVDLGNLNLGDSIHPGNVLPLEWLSDEDKQRKLKQVQQAQGKTAAVNSPDELPPDPGTAPIPAGHIRVWHYTRTPNLDSIRQHGLSMNFAKGEQTHETNQIWGATGPAPDEVNHLAHGNKAFVEFHMDPKDLNFGRGESPEKLNSEYHHITTMKDVPPENILGIHEPWHQHVRYMRDGYEDPVKEFSWLKDDPPDEDYGKAYNYLARNQGKTAAAAGSGFAHDTYAGERTLRQQAFYPRNITQEQAEAKLQEVLTQHGVPLGHQAFVELSHAPGDSSSAWDTDTAPWTPGVRLSAGMHDHLTLLHEAAHIIDNYKMYGGAMHRRPPEHTTDDVHDGHWLETYRQLVHDHTHASTGRKFDETFPPDARPKVRTPWDSGKVADLTAAAQIVHITAALSDEDRVSVAEEAMERGGHSGRTFTVPVNKGDWQADREHDAARYLHMVLIGHGHPEAEARQIRVYPDSWNLRGGGLAVTDGYNTVGTHPQTNEMTLLHEAAHILTHTPEGEGHGPEFQQVLHSLYHKHLGPDAASIFGGITGPGEKTAAASEHRHDVENGQSHGPGYTITSHSTQLNRDWKPLQEEFRGSGMQMSERHTGMPRSKVAVARDHSTGKVIGAIQYSRDARYYRSDPENYSIEDVHVHKDHQRRGIGRALLAHVASQTRPGSSMKVSSAVETAVPWYQSTGANFPSAYGQHAEWHPQMVDYMREHPEGVKVEVPDNAIRTQDYRHNGIPTDMLPRLDPKTPAEYHLATAEDPLVCPADGIPLEYDPLDGYQHEDGSIGHDGGATVTDHLQAAGIPLQPSSETFDLTSAIAYCEGAENATQGMLSVLAGMMDHAGDGVEKIALSQDHLRIASESFHGAAEEFRLQLPIADGYRSTADPGQVEFYQGESA